MKIIILLATFWLALGSSTQALADDRGAAAANPNTPPEVLITYPPTDFIVSGGNFLVVKASASDSDGSVVQVEFFENGVWRALQPRRRLTPLGRS